MTRILAGDERKKTFMGPIMKEKTFFQGKVITFALPCGTDMTFSAGSTAATFFAYEQQC